MLVRCLNCEKAFLDDINDSLNVAYSSDIARNTENTGIFPRIALEIKCLRCKMYITMFEGESIYETRGSSTGLV